MIDVGHYSRNSFLVDAVRVTPENMAEVAEWCGGEIHDDNPERNPTQHLQYIKVRVENPLTVRQTTAFVGDWVLYAGKGYKVYTNRAFSKSFSLSEQKLPERIHGVVSPDEGLVDLSGDSETEEGVVANVFEQGEARKALNHDLSVQNPGGTPSV